MMLHPPSLQTGREDNCDSWGRRMSALSPLLQLPWLVPAPNQCLWSNGQGVEGIAQKLVGYRM